MVSWPMRRIDICFVLFVFVEEGECLFTFKHECVDLLTDILIGNIPLGLLGLNQDIQERRAPLLLRLLISLLSLEQSLPLPNHQVGKIMQSLEDPPRFPPSWSHPIDPITSVQRILEASHHAL